jgi:hypothetical protein
MHEQSLRFTDAALSLFTEAQWLRHEATNMERTTCVLYARAGRAALCALLGANDADLSSAAGTSNLLELVDTLHAQRDPLAANSKDHARRLSAVLVMDRTDAGRDYVTRELFDRDDVLKCEEGASYMLTACLQRLFGIDLSKALFLHGASNGGPPFRYFLPRERDDDDPDT